MDRAGANGSSDPNTLALSENHLNFRFDLDKNRQKFTSFSEKFGPMSLDGDSFTALQQWNFNDSLITSNETTGAGMDVTGYGSRINFTQPFPAENIVMLYDGVCASTCTIFSELMRNQGKVKSIALGGRPSAKAIQGVGGVKGSQSLAFDDMFTFAQFFLEVVPNSTFRPVLESMSNLPQNRSLDDGFNFSDHILDKNLKDGLPAQYVQEPADCRMLFTPAMVRDGGVSEIWEQAANRAFGGQSCVQGGISNGVVSAKRAPITTQSKVAMAAAADAARTTLEAVQRKALLAPAVRMAGWASLHGRAIPNMYMD